MFHKTLLLAATVALAPLAQAQVVQFGGSGQQETASLFYFNRKAQTFLGGVEISYGAPDWKAEHGKHVESKKDQSFRLGKDGWSRLSNDVPVKMGGVAIPAGNWCLGLRKQDGKFSLMVLSAETVRKKKIPSWMTAQVRKGEINVPLTHKKVEKIAEKLTITLDGNQGKVGKSLFTFHWGPHQLQAEVHAKLPAAKKKSDFGGNGK